MSAPTPLLDFFKRGEVARDVRLLAAQGALAPRAHEQLAILVLLLEDSDPEIRAVATATLNRIPEESIRGVLARSDVPAGSASSSPTAAVFPAEVPLADVDAPLLDAEPEADFSVLEEEKENPQSIRQRISKMMFPERLKAALKGTGDARDPGPRSRTR